MSVSGTQHLTPIPSSVARKSRLNCIKCKPPLYTHIKKITQSDCEISFDQPCHVIGRGISIHSLPLLIRFKGSNSHALISFYTLDQRSFTLLESSHIFKANFTFSFSLFSLSSKSIQWRIRAHRIQNPLKRTPCVRSIAFWLCLRCVFIWGSLKLRKVGPKAVIVNRDNNGKALFVCTAVCFVCYIYLQFLPNDQVASQRERLLFFFFFTC